MGTLRLTVMRHGHAERIETAPEDHVRQLTERGRGEASGMGERLRRAGLVPDRILASSAQRTRATAQLAAAALGLPESRIDTLDELYNAAEQQIWDVIRGRAGTSRHVLLIGHNPGLSRLASELAAASGSLPQRIDLPPAGLLTVKWPTGTLDWQGLHASLAGDAQLLLP
jgi:phosphohistidine phosphatase